MGILKRLIGRLAGADPAAMAESMGRHVAAQWDAADREDDAAAMAALRALDAEVRELVDRHGTTAVYAAVSHWAASAPRVLTLKVSAFLAEHDTLSTIVRSFGTDGTTAGTGLMVFEEGLNRAGFVMSPSYLDKAHAHILAAEPAPPEPLAALADVLWPQSEAETALRERLGELAGITVHRAAWELFALRDAAFEFGSNMALGDMERQDVLERKVHQLVDRRVGDTPPIENLAGWYADRHGRYLAAFRTIDESEGSHVGAVRWLDGVRAAFQACLGREDAVIGQIGGAEYDRALMRSREICEGFDSSKGPAAS